MSHARRHCLLWPPVLLLAILAPAVVLRQTREPRKHRTKRPSSPAAAGGASTRPANIVPTRRVPAGSGEEVAASGSDGRVLHRPDDFIVCPAFPASGDSPDIRAIETEYPELRGIVLTAPEFIEECDLIRKQACEPATSCSILQYRIIPGTILAIDAEDEPENSTTVLVPPGGEWYFPFGKVRMEGLTIEELKYHIEEKLREYGLRRPIVTVNVLPGGAAQPAARDERTEAWGEPILVVTDHGVLLPIVFDGRQTLVGVLTDLGIPDWQKSRRTLIVRRDPINPAHRGRIILCDPWAYVALSDVRQDVPLAPGDLVLVLAMEGPDPQVPWSLLQRFVKGEIERASLVR